MKIIIDDATGKPPMIFNTKDKDLINSVLHTLSMSGVKRIIPDSCILAYRNEEVNHYHFGGIDQHEMSFLTEEVLDAIIKEIGRVIPNE